MFVNLERHRIVMTECVLVNRHGTVEQWLCLYVAALDGVEAGKAV
jgi:hypothetical protein